MRGKEMQSNAADETPIMKPLLWDVAGLLQVIDDPERGYTESALTAFCNEDGSQATIGEVRAYLVDCQRRGVTFLPE
jgi:hypothetical protein